MGISKQVFLGLLETQNKLEYVLNNEQIKFSFANKSVLLRLGDEGVRRFGAARLPILAMHFDFSELTDVEQASFMKLFLLKFQRGGG
ncbi:MAG: hypothetical protein KBT50_05350 [Cycloclasticus sp.]|nr:hypothetical protein [Cycloclasticus sp.]MBQ0790028.1 hypothetical protein [Cycloclasticus sp.]